MTRAALLVLALLAGCNDSDRFRAETEAEHPKVWSTHYTFSVSEARKVVVENCIRRQLVAWEIDANKHIPDFDVEIRPEQFDCGGVHGVLACVDVPRRDIYQFVGGETWGLLPGLYHEFWHIEINDPEHKDPRWADWNKRAFELSRPFWPLWEEAGG